MAKKRSNRPNNNQRANQPRPTASRNAASVQQASDLKGAADQAATAHSVTDEVVQPSSSAVTAEMLQAALKDAHAAKAIFDKATAAVERAATEQSATQENQEKQRSELVAEKDKLEAERGALAAERAAHAEAVESQAAEAERLAREAADAEAGFLARRDEILGPVKERIAELTAAWHAQEQQLITDWDSELRHRSEELRDQARASQTDLDSKRAEIEAAQDALALRVSEADRSRRQLDLEHQSLQEDRHALDAERPEIAEQAVRALAPQLREAVAARDRLLDRLQEFEADKAAMDSLRNELGGDPAQVLNDMFELKAQLSEAQSELSTRPSTAVQEELDAARLELVQAREDRDKHARALREIMAQADHQSTRVAEVERLELTAEALQSSIGAYRSEIEDLRSQFDQLRADTDRQSAFPECRRIDLEVGTRLPEEGRQVSDLKDFVEDLQRRMAMDPDAVASGKRLNYRLQDIRIFLAGLAMSRLHLLEGVSGTGKTTLPHAVAAAVGGGVKKIEIQAGWRDKQDLLGYYNSFERVYRETACLQSLYKAGQPAFTDRLVFIVLDEMNLSHPEQYFADFLSALEDPKSVPLLSLVDRGLPDLPDQMRADAGVQLPLAPNVWFIGTANQDETTYAFAPKTYDRAHVMELKPNAPPVAPGGERHDPRPVSLTSLRSAFDEAGRSHAPATSTAQGFVHGLSDFFAERFDVGWGNRLDLHIQAFVPVVVAAGGTLGEALDHVVATKVLRKIQGRHTLRKESLEELAELIDRDWPDRTVRPVVSQETITAEIRRLDY